MTKTDAIKFVQVGDMVGKSLGVLDEDDSERRVLVSPAVYSLLESDKWSTLRSLWVTTPNGTVWVMDLFAPDGRPEAPAGEVAEG